MTNHPEAALRALEQKWREMWADNRYSDMQRSTWNQVADELAAILRQIEAAPSESRCEISGHCKLNGCVHTTFGLPTWKEGENPFKTSPPDSSQGEPERIAQLIAHRACLGGEHDPANGKLHGCCVVCGVPWPCEYAGTPPPSSPQVAVALNWRCDGFDHHGRVVAVEKSERRRFHVYALKDDRWQADFYADHELPEYTEVGKYPDARSAMRACDDFLHENDPVDYSGGDSFDPTKLRPGEDEDTANDEPLFTASVYGTAERAAKAREEWLAAKGEPQAKHWCKAFTSSCDGRYSVAAFEQLAHEFAQAEQAAKGEGNG